MRCRACCKRRCRLSDVCRNCVDASCGAILPDVLKLLSSRLISRAPQLVRDLLFSFQVLGPSGVSHAGDVVYQARFCAWLRTTRGQRLRSQEDRAPSTPTISSCREACRAWATSAGASSPSPCWLLRTPPSPCEMHLPLPPHPSCGSRIESS